MKKRSSDSPVPAIAVTSATCCFALDSVGGTGPWQDTSEQRGNEGPAFLPGARLAEAASELTRKRSGRGRGRGCGGGPSPGSLGLRVRPASLAKWDGAGAGLTWGGHLMRSSA